MTTQIGSIPQPSGRLFSIVMTDEHLPEPSVISESQRAARYDGVLCYDPGWILVIENKPDSRNVWPEQLNPVLPSNHEIIIDKVLVDIPWRSAIERLTRLLELNLISGIEGQVLADFLFFIDTHFPMLNPFTTIGVCKKNLYLLQKRCSGILEEIAPGRVQYHRGFKDYIVLGPGPAKQAFLYPWQEENQVFIGIDIYPGDTITQARDFYTRMDPTQFIELQNKRWNLSPNMHFSFAATNLVTVKDTGISPQDYLKFWRSHVEAIHQVELGGAGRDAYFRDLLASNIIGQDDLVELDKTFFSTKRSVLNPCPGFCVSLSWPLEEASQLDASGGFRSAVIERMNEALQTWGQGL